MSAKLERIYWLAFLRHRRLISLAYHVGHSDRINRDSPRKVEPYRQSYGIFKGGRELREITLKFDPYMARFVGGMFRHPEQRGENTPDGGLRLTIPVADFTEITMRILSFGRHVEVLAPEELRRRVAEEVGEMAKKALPAEETQKARQILIQKVV